MDNAIVPSTVKIPFDLEIKRNLESTDETQNTYFC